LGRVGVTLDAQPAIFPVNFAVLDDEVVFRTAPGTKLCAATVHHIVAFEIDEATADGSSGWSVLVVGHAAQIRQPAMLGRARALGLQTWAPGERDYFVKISTERLSGRAYGTDLAGV
jgi:nitroimidazol reductase NimA-like FMN-containing flavoprotein (pyridoxamine 5'-phosphate oxidase superfamily)